MDALDEIQQNIEDENPEDLDQVILTRRHSIFSRKQTMIEEKPSDKEEEKETEWNGDYNLLATEEEPAQRPELPWLKDPGMKAGLWAMLKDNIGKDLTRIALPVTFNEPLSLT